ncbi:rod shape-determining protein MreC [Lactobacillus intestinalis]|uniref:Cell shape-determining protein MreC n=1 Tax=Lactobacillus intestinalis DSM 6629 TaxID=1423761 RepID=A0ABR5PRP9_9LACO|nr:rod shape-determining protein MreC [Lactobacillus intestinalis]KRM33961.1 cell shape determining protein [Lactobacillus intestinalis DSM 6629]UTW39779.1 rod shape-determining protein MreC [Lactobacillus intestinalis]
MKKFLENKKLLSAFVIVIVILSILGGSVSLRNKRNTPLLIQSFGNDVVGVGARIVDIPLGWVSGGLNNVHSILTTQSENDHLKSQVTNLGQTKARNSTLEAENKQLRSALKLKDTLSGYSMVDASVISRSSDTWSDLLVINKGSSAGIQKNMAVMCGGGVIGRIIEVNAASSKVELITTTDKSANRFSVQATASNGKSVHGIITVDSDGSLAFTQVVDSRKLKQGTRVYTSGMGGNSPKGLLIGTVATTTRDSFGLSDLIKINPAGELNDPSVVTVIRRKVAN